MTPEDRIRSAIITDPNNERKLMVVSQQDCTDILEKNHINRDIKKKGDWAWPLAEIPNILITQWLNEEWARGNTKLRLGREFNETVVRKKLADPNYKYLLV